MMHVLKAPFVFVWKFVVGDQPWIAFGVALTLVLAALVRHGDAGWIIVPVAVGIVLSVSVRLWRVGPDPTSQPRR